VTITATRPTRTPEDGPEVLFKEARRRRRRRRVLYGLGVLILALAVTVFVGISGPGQPKGPTQHAADPGRLTPLGAVRASSSAKAAVSADAGLPIGSLGLIGSGGLWVLNGDGLFISSNDGASWTRTDPPSAGDPLADLIDVDFISSTQGWVVAANETGVLVDRTSDGGRTWESVPLPSSVVSSGFGSAYVSFANPLDGLVTVQPWDPQASASIVFGSTDGGAAWSMVEGNAPVSAVELLTPQTGWGLNPASTVLYRTTDGGASWQPADITVTSAPGHTLTTPKFFGADGYLLAIPKSGKAVVEETFDGGAVWHAEEAPFAAALASHGRPSSPAGDPLCVGCVEPFAVVSPSEWIFWGGDALWRTTDGGGTWRSIRPFVSAAGFTSSAKDGETSTALLQFSSGAEGWVVAATGLNGPSAMLLRTQDGGRRFAVIRQPLHRFEFAAG
jgi:hypothetical protein